MDTKIIAYKDYVDEKISTKVNELTSDLTNKIDGYINPTVVALISDGTAYTNESGSYILAESATGLELLNNTETYTTTTATGNFYRMAGADSVNPFNSSKGISIEYKEVGFKGMNYTTSNECIFSICAYSARRLDTSSYKYVYDGDLGDPKDIIQNMIVITGGEIEQLGYNIMSLPGCVHSSESDPDNVYVACVGQINFKCTPTESSMNITIYPVISEAGMGHFIEKIPL